MTGKHTGKSPDIETQELINELEVIYFSSGDWRKITKHVIRVNEIKQRIKVLLYG